MSNVKPGDRAIIVRANNPGNVGRVVLVVEEFTQTIQVEDVPLRYDLFSDLGLHWIVESLGSPLHFTKLQTRFETGKPETSGEPRQLMVGIAADANLRRLDPPEEEQSGDQRGLSAPIKDSQTVVEEQAS